jgi:hypothetical protein
MVLYPVSAGIVGKLLLGLDRTCDPEGSGSGSRSFQLDMIGIGYRASRIGFILFASAIVAHAQIIVTTNGARQMGMGKGGVALPDMAQGAAPRTQTRSARCPPGRGAPKIAV